MAAPTPTHAHQHVQVHGCGHHYRVLTATTSPDSEWAEQNLPPESLCPWASGQTPAPPPSTTTHGAEVVAVFANADQVRECKRCKDLFSRTFEMPEEWWSPFSRRSPGFFGCDSRRNDRGEITTYNAWCRFQIKQLTEEKYHWYKLNIFTHWLARTGQTAMLIFDYHQDLRGEVHKHLLDKLKGSGNHRLMTSPLWAYTSILNDVSRLQNHAVWTIRTQVRDGEKERLFKDTNYEMSDYSRWNELARHAIHVSETLDLTVKTAKMIMEAHEWFMEEMKASAVAREGHGISQQPNFADVVALGGARNVHEKLQFYEHIIEGLRQRSASTKARLVNETQLKFTMSSESIAKATRADSADMRTVAFLTLAFLPATFISAIFSTSFFNYDQDTGEWVVSSKIWIYFAFAAPATVLTTLIWFLWNKMPQIWKSRNAGNRAVSSETSTRDGDDNELLKRLRATFTDLTTYEKPKDGGELGV